VILVWLGASSIAGRGVSPDGGKKRASLSALYDEARGLELKGAYINARAAYKDILDRAKDASLIRKTEESLMALNMKILFSPLLTEDSTVYSVEKGDTLGKIAKRFNTTVELLMRSNNLKSDIIRPGQKLNTRGATPDTINNLM